VWVLLHVLRPRGFVYRFEVLVEVDDGVFGDGVVLDRSPAQAVR
jgi:hypothetical protein